MPSPLQIPPELAATDPAVNQAPQPSENGAQASSSNEAHEGTPLNLEKAASAPVDGLSPKDINPQKSILRTAASLRAECQRNVSWRDETGRELVDVVEYEPR